MANSQQEASENHWPGYVDALTTMLMVLTFVMLILGVAIFAMSQNVSRVIVESIARASLIDVPDESVPVPELVERILDKLRLHPPRPPVQITHEARPVPGQASPGQSSPGQFAPAPGREDERRFDQIEGIPPGGGDHQRIVSQATAHVPGAPAAIQSRSEAQTLVIDFQPRATRLDEAGGARLSETIRDDSRYRDAASIEIRASIDRSLLSITDARRIAFYRAISVRESLLRNGVPADRIRVHVDETATEPAGTTTERVRVIARN